MSRINALFITLAAVICLTLAAGCASTKDEAIQMDACAQQAQATCGQDDGPCYDQEYTNCMEAEGYFVR